MNVTPVYRRQYLVRAYARGWWWGDIELDPRLIEGAGWYDAGSTALVRARRGLWFESFSILPWGFKEWRGDISSVQETIVLTVDSPKTLVAIYEVRVPIYAVQALSAILAACALVIVLKAILPKIIVMAKLQRLKEDIASGRLGEEEGARRVKEIVGPHVESARKVIAAFADWLEGVSEVRAGEILTWLERLEGPLEHLELYFKGIDRYEKVMKEVGAMITDLEHRKPEEALSKEELKRYKLCARRWVEDVGNLHYDWARRVGGPQWRR